MSQQSERLPTGPKAGAREIVFIDPAVPDIGTIAGSLRPEVEAVVLDGTRPATPQIAAALAERRVQSVVHVIAHGKPGRVGLSGGAWTSRTLAGEADDLARIGRAIGRGGSLRLWSCFTGAGPEGSAFIAGLERATSVPVAAAEGLVGAQALGGQWALKVGTGAVAAQTPLTERGIRDYAEVLATRTWDGSSSNAWGTTFNWSGNALPVAGDVVIIPTGLTTYPVISAGTNNTNLSVST